MSACCWNPSEKTTLQKWHRPPITRGMMPVAELHAGADATLNERREAVVLACPDAAARARLEALLAEEDLLVVPCETAAEAERQLAGARPDLLVLWAPSEEPEALRLLERLREDAD